MKLLRLAPTFEIFDELSIEDQSWQIAKEFGICNGWRVNFAIDQNGLSFGSSGDSSDVSSALDRQVLAKLRSLSDIIVTSGKTARVERYKSSKFAPIAVFTKSGELDTIPAIQGTQYFTPLILTPSDRVENVEEQLSDVDVRTIAYDMSFDKNHSWSNAIAAAIQHQGFKSPILESGLTTLRDFFASRVVDEVCLTISVSSGSQLSARVLSPAFLKTVFGSFADFELRNLFVAKDGIFSRWVRNGVA